MLDIIHDIEELCPNAIGLNYTNPMAMLVSYLQAQTEISVTGLCHSVQGTAEMLAGWLGLKPQELQYTCAGINHQAFYLKLLHNGQDLSLIHISPSLYREGHAAPVCLTLPAAFQSTLPV